MGNGVFRQHRFRPQVVNAYFTTDTFSCDAAGRLATVTNSLGKVTRHSSTPIGQREHTWGTGAAAPVEYEYNDYGWRSKMRTWQNTLYSDGQDAFGGDT